MKAAYKIGKGPRCTMCPKYGYKYVVHKSIKLICKACRPFISPRFGGNPNENVGDNEMAELNTLSENEPVI